MELENIVEYADDGRYRARPSRPTGVMVHRIGVDLVDDRVIGYTGPQIVDAFIGNDLQWREVARVTGGQNPYTFYVGGDEGPDGYDGVIWQALALSEVGHHARIASPSYIGIGLIGDFRVRAPGQRQLRESVELTAHLCLAYGIDPSSVKGHGEVGNAHGGEKSLDSQYACPGKCLDMSTFRAMVQSRMAALGQHFLEDVGILS